MQKLKRISVLLCLPLLVGFTTPNDSTYSKVTTNPKIIQSLNCLDGTTGEWAKKAILGNNLTNRPVNVQFKNLGEMSPAYANFDALGWKDRSGRLNIFINQKHRNAPPEAVASLLSHEACHQDTYNSTEEETYAWTMEAEVWTQMKNHNPALNQYSPDMYPLVKRLNTLEYKFKQGKYTSAYIRPLVEGNSGYRGLPKYSPGFEAKDIYNAVWTHQKYTQTSMNETGQN